MEKIIYLTSSLDSETQKTVYVGLTSDGRIFRSHNLKKWKLVSTPNFNDNNPNTPD